MRPLLLAAALLLIAAPASAAVQVLGGGFAERCWRATQGGDGSARDCDEALMNEALSPADRAATFVNRGVLRLRDRVLDKAVADFDRALALRPGLGEALVNRGAARIAQRRYAEALGDLDSALAAGVAEPEKAWFNKGLAHEGQGDLRAAYAAYRQAQTLRPDWDAPARELRRFTVRPAE